MAKPTAEEPLSWVVFSEEEKADLPHLVLAKELVHIVDSYWCKHVRQGMCDRCQKDRVRDVQWRLQKLHDAAEAAARAEGRSYQ